MRKFIPLAVLTSALLLVGCAPKNDYFVSTENLQKDNVNNYILVNDFIDFIGNYYNPSVTKFVIEPANQFSPFLEIFETRLREKGYGVSYATMNEAAWLAWKIQSVDDDTILVTYHVQDSKYTKLYKKVHGKYAPVGAFTIFNPKAEINQKPDPLPELKEEIVEHNTTVTEPTPQKEAPIIQNDVWKTFVQSNSYLHIRQKPTIKSKIVGTLKRDTQIEGDGNFAHKNWVKIDQMEGFVSKRYLKYVHPKTEGDLVYEPKK